MAHCVCWNQVQVRMRNFESSNYQPYPVDLERCFLGYSNFMGDIEEVLA